MYGAVELGFRHGRLVEEILGATGYLAVEDSVRSTLHIQPSTKLIIDAYIDDAEVEAVLTTEHIDATAASGEVEHLLPRHLAWRHADSLALDAVVAAEQQVTGMGQRRFQRLLDEAQLHSQLFQAS